MAKGGGIPRVVNAIVARAFLRVTSHLPLTACQAIGAALGPLGYYLVPRVRRVGMENLDRAYGDSLTRREKKAIVKGALTNACIVAAEFSHLAKLSGPLLEEQVELHGREHLDGLKACVIIGGHFGNWEWMAPVLQAHGYRMAEIVRPLDNPGLNRAVDALGRAGGTETVGKDRAGTQIFDLLRDGVRVGILIDQSPREGGVPVTFFGAPCWATVAPAMIALRSKAPLVLAEIRRLPDGRYRYEIHPPLEIPRSGNILHDLVAITQLCQDGLEAIIREHPEQWLWVHRRWKERPRLAAEWQARVERQGVKARPGEE